MEHHDDDFIPIPTRPIHGVFQDLATAVIEEPVWIVKDLLPKGITIIGGPPKCGKSTITAAIAALVANFKCKALPTFMSKVERHGTVMWLSAEANAGELKDMMVNGLNVTNWRDDESILVADDPFEFRLDDDDAWQRLHGWLEELKPTVTIIDPLAEFHDLDEKVAGDMIRLLRPIRKWAVDNNKAVLFVHHTSKKTGENKGDNYDAGDMRGSGALFGKADGVIMVTPKGKKHEQRMHVNAVFKRAAGWVKEITLAAYGNEVAQVHLSDLAKKIYIMMGIGAQTVEDMEPQLQGIAPSSIKESIMALEENKLIKKVGKDRWIPTAKK